MDREDYMGLFYAEAYEQVQMISDSLLRVDSGEATNEDIDELFRAAHSMKGMSAAVGMDSVASLTHKMEDIFDCFRSGVSPSDDLVGLLLNAVGQVEALVDRGGDEGEPDEETRRLLARLQEAHEALTGEESTTEDAESFALAETAAESENESSQAQSGPAERFQEAGPRPNLPLAGGSSHSASEYRQSFRVQLTISDDAPMKTVRAIVLVDQLNEFGAISKKEPDPEQTEESDFDGCFTVWLSGPDSEEEIEEYVEGLPEVEDVSVAVAHSEDEGKPREEEAEKSKSNRESNTSAKPSPNGKTSNREKYIRIETERLDSLMNMVGELVTTRTRVADAASQSTANGVLRETVEELNHVTTDLQNSVMKLRMVPVEQVFARFPRVVRSLSAEMSKKVQLELEPGDAELDRTIANRIGDLLVHLVRNSVDHGIEQPEERAEKGKDPAGTIHLRARHEGGVVVIEVEDDGRGLDRERILNTAVRRGVVTEEGVASLTDDEVHQLVLAPGFSTTEKVTNVSGRGVGMDAVKSGVEELKGTVELNSTQGEGTRVTLRLPLTLAIMSALLVNLREEIYAIPLEAVYRNLAVTPDEVDTIHGRPVLQFQGEVLPLIRPFAVGDEIEESISQYTVIVVEFQRHRVGLLVDDIRGQQEIVIKSLGRTLANVEGISGSTVLGNGQVALILDIQNLVQTRLRTEVY